MWFVRGLPSENQISPVIKYLLFAFNLLFWFIAAAVVGVSIWAFATKALEDSKRVTSVWDYLFDLTIILLIVGLTAMTLSFAGCIGALRENVCLLRFFYILLLLLFAIVLIAGIVGFALHRYLLNLVNDHVSMKWVKNYEDDPDLRDLTNYVQEEFKCCGISQEGSYKDWTFNPYFNCSAENPDPRRCSVPYSCCRPESLMPPGYVVPNHRCGAEMQSKTNADAVKSIYTEGCVDAVIEAGERSILIICAVTVGLSLVPLLGVLLSVTLISQIEDQKAQWTRSRYEFNMRRM